MKTTRSFIERVFVEFQRDEIIILSAAFVYYAALSIIPLLLFLLALLSLSVEWFAALADLVDEQVATVGAVMGAEAQSTINAMLNDLRRGSLIATIIGLVIMVWGASIVFRFLRISFRKIFGQLQRANDATDAARELLAYSTIDRFWGFLLVFLLGVLFVASVFLMAIAQIVMAHLNISTSARSFYQMIDFLLAFALVMVTLSILYRFLPPITLSFSMIAPGALAASIAYVILRFSVGIYLSYVAPATPYGAFGALLVLLVYMYFGGLIFYIGAEMTKVRMMGQTIDSAQPAGAEPAEPIPPEQ